MIDPQHLASNKSIAMLNFNLLFAYSAFVLLQLTSQKSITSDLPASAVDANARNSVLQITTGAVHNLRKDVRSRRLLTIQSSATYVLCTL